MTKTLSHAWWVVVALSVVSAVIWGTTLSTMGMFLAPVKEAFGASNADVARGSTFFIMAMTLVTPGLGWLIDRLGVRLVTVAGALVTATGYWLAARSSDVPTFVTAMTLAGAGVGASTYVPTTLVIASWVEQKRGMAMGVYMAITALGSAVFPVWVAHLLSGRSWRDTLLWIAIVVAAISIPLLLAFARIRPRVETTRSLPNDARDAPAAAAEEIFAEDLAKALRNRGFWWLGVTQVLSGLSFQGVYLYIIPHLMNSGYSTEKAAALFGITNVTTMGGFLVFGYLADRFGPRRALALGLILAGVSTPLLLGASHTAFGLAVIVTFAILWGATSSLTNQLVPLALVEVVGLRNFGSILGVSYVMYGLAMSAGPLVTGHLYDVTHSYREPFWLFTVLMLLAAAPLLRRRS